MRGGKSFAYDLIASHGRVRGRVALLLRSTERKPPWPRFGERPAQTTGPRPAGVSLHAGRRTGAAAGRRGTQGDREGTAACRVPERWRSPSRRARAGEPVSRAFAVAGHFARQKSVCGRCRLDTRPPARVGEYFSALDLTLTLRVPSRGQGPVYTMNITKPPAPDPCGVAGTTTNLPRTSPSPPPCTKRRLGSGESRLYMIILRVSLYAQARHPGRRFTRGPRGSEADRGLPR